MDYHGDTMDLLGQKLQSLRRRMGTWGPRLRQATGATSVTFPSEPDGCFRVVIEWKGKTGPGSFQKEFNKQNMFSVNGAGPVHKPCDYVRQMIEEVLKLRGVV